MYIFSRQKQKGKHVPSLLFKDKDVIDEGLPKLDGVSVVWSFPSSWPYILPLILQQYDNAYPACSSGDNYLMY